MIIFDVRCIKCGNVQEEWFKSSSQYELDCDLVVCNECGCAGVEKAPTAPMLIAGSGSIKNPDSFNELLRKVSDANPVSPLAERHGDKGVTATKIREVNKKVKKRLGME